MTHLRGQLGLWAVAVWLGGCAVPIAANLEESDANRVVVALEESGIAADKDADPAAEGRWRVTVARDDASGAAAVLGQENLPGPASPGVLDTLGESSLVPSRTAEHAKLVVGTQGDLERSLRAVDGVLGARVHLAVPARAPFEGGDKPETATASVLIRHRGATPPIAARDVQNLVAGAVTGLAPEKVSVVLTPVATPTRTHERDLSRLGPITVTRSSLNPLRIGVGIVVLVNVVLIGLLLALWMRVRKTQAVLDETRAQAGHR
jgi:type III secretion protein J